VFELRALRWAERRKNGNTGPYQGRDLGTVLRVQEKAGKHRREEVWILQGVLGGYGSGFRISMKGDGGVSDMTFLTSDMTDLSGVI